LGGRAENNAIRLGHKGWSFAPVGPMIAVVVALAETTRAPTVGATHAAPLQEAALILRAEAG